MLFLEQINVWEQKKKEMGDEENTSCKENMYVESSRSGGTEQRRTMEEVNSAMTQCKCHSVSQHNSNMMMLITKKRTCEEGWGRSSLVECLPGAQGPGFDTQHCENTKQSQQQKA